MIGIQTDEIINKALKSLLTSCQEVLEIKITGSDFLFDYADRLTFLCHEISSNCKWVIYRFS